MDKNNTVGFRLLIESNSLKNIYLKGAARGAFYKQTHFASLEKQLRIIWINKIINEFRSYCVINFFLIISLILNFFI